MSSTNRSRRSALASTGRLRYVVGGISVLLFFWCATETMSSGLSQLYSARAITSHSLSSATTAVSLAPSDSETYRVRAAVLAGQNRFNEASVDLTQAVTLSPSDWKLWVELGNTYKQDRELTAAIAAYSEAIRWAPSFGGPHWLLATCLIEAGEIEEGFIELRTASRLTPTLFTQAIDLAWQSFENNPAALQRFLQAETVSEEIELSMFLGKHDRLEEAVPLLRRAAPLLSEGDRALLLEDLMNAGRYEEAHAVWAAGINSLTSSTADETPSISNGGFEDAIVLHDRGFGWRFRPATAAVNVSSDASDRYSGNNSLRLDWHGDVDRSVPVLQQLVLVTPKERYRLAFAARTESQATICAPMITVNNPKASLKLLAQSVSLTEEGSEWHKYTLEFFTEETTKVVSIVVTREQGPDGPCPIFGSTWLDDFSLERI